MSALGGEHGALQTQQEGFGTSEGFPFLLVQGWGSQEVAVWPAPTL